MADVKLPNISTTNLNGSQNNTSGLHGLEGQNAYNDSQPRNDARSQSYHSGRGADSGNGFGQVGRSIMEAKKQRKE